MSNKLKLLLIVTSVLIMIALVGCQDNNVPRPAAAGIVSGTVVDSGENAIAGVNVITTDGTDVWTDVTDENGNYELTDVTPGSRVIAFYGEGWITEYVSVVVGNIGATGDAQLDATEGTPDDTPIINIDEPGFNAEAGIASLTGTINNLDTETAVLIVNGSATTISTSLGSFDTVAILQPGDNTVYIWAVNALGDTLSDPLNFTFTPSGDLFFRVTLTWDGPSDLDLHTWQPDLEHCYYSNATTADLTLDADNTDSDGPENMTCSTLEDGRFRVGVNAYTLDDVSRQATIRVSVFSGPNEGNTYTFGPYTFTSDGEDYPVIGDTAAWWRPCDVLVSGSDISVVAPDNTSLEVGATMSRGKSK